MALSTDDEISRTVNFSIEDNILIGALEPVDSDRKLGPIILDAFNKHPNHVSQIDAETGEQTTYEEMKNRSIRCALWLKNLGIGANDIIVACTHNHLDSYIPVVATFFLDAIFNAWNYNITTHTARRFMNQFKPKVIFTCESAADVLREASQLEKINVNLVVFGNHPTLPILTEIINYQTKEEISNFTVVNVKSPKEPALIWLSSGSTGHPKGVMKSNKALLSNLLKQRYSEYVSLTFLSYSSLEWTSCIVIFLTTILTKQTRIIPTYCEVENAFQVIEKYKVDQVCFPPVLMTYIARSKMIQKYNLKSLNVIINGGTKFSKEVLKELQQKIPSAFMYNVYGTTEIGVIANATSASKHIDSVGFISTNCRMKFVDLISGKSLGPNQHGEIYAKSPAYMNGYYNSPEETGEACDEDGWYHTGDIGYYDETGEIFIIDRIKELIKFKGQHISPVEIEEVLLSHPAIQEAVVVALPHKIDVNWLTAFCKKTPESKVTEEELMELTSVLEDYKKIRGGIHFIDNFPYTSSGKIARNEVKFLARNLIKIDNES